ncbi:MAG: TonB-dependent receptor [Tannerella sp.]|nr:TonB-dependent receptor [Tannerella sp.]
MRVALFFILICASATFAANIQSQTAVVNISGNNIKAKEVIKQIEDQTDYLFVYNNTIDLSKKVSIDAEKTPVAEILSYIFTDTDVIYAMEGNNILLMKANKQLQDQQKPRQITGIVKDQNDEEVIGANVIVKGTTIGNITDINGRFILEVPETGILQVSYIGYYTVEVKIDHQNEYFITLTEDTKALDEVVVVGYGTQVRRNVATAISSVSGDKLGDIPVQSPIQALVGQVAGLDLQQRSGAPGEEPSVRIRGIGSISSGNGPLYVIDGYPTNDAGMFNAINPNDIASIDIMKDAASAAIYGSRAGNGVILVTTKKGKKDHWTFNFDMNVGVDQIMHKYPLMNAEEYAEMAIEFRQNQGLSVPEILTNRAMWKETDWQDVIFRSGMNQSYNLSAIGGSEKIQFAISGGYNDVEGIVKNTYNKRYNARINVDAQPTNWLRIGINLQPSFQIQRTQSLAGGNTTTNDGILAEALSMPPILPAWKDNGDYFVIFQEAKNNPVNYGIFNAQLSNPLNKLDGFKNIYKTFRQTGSTYIEIEPLKNLKVRSSLNLGYYNRMRDYYVEAFVAKGNGDTGNLSTPNLARIDAERRTDSNINLYWSNTITYDLNLNSDHEFSFLLGYDAAKQDDFYTRVIPRTDADTPVAFDNTVVKSVEGAILKSGESGNTSYLFDAVFGRVSYNYKSKYIFSGSIRQDRSSRFGSDNRAGVFPSISGAWNIREEDFMKSIPVISALKIRASYGETGNDQLPGYYPWLTTMSKDYYVVGAGESESRVVGYKPGGFNNVNLGWEKNRQLDFGLDIAVLKNRISLIIDYYNRKSNTILESALPTINGKASTVMLNAGEVENKGWEFALHTINLDGVVKWRSTINFANNKNKLVSLDGDKAGLNVTGARRNYVGRPFGDFYMYIVEGTFNTPEDVEKYAKNGTQTVGDLRFKDVSGPDGVPDGVINSYDQVYVGNAQPDFTFGISNSFSYNNFDLNIMLDGQVGGYVYRREERALSLSRALENSSKDAVDRWRSAENPGNGSYHKAGTVNLSSNIGDNTRYLYETDYLRIRTVTLGYTLPRLISDKLLVRRARIYITGNNLHIFTNVGGFNNPHGSSVNETATIADGKNNWGYNEGAYPLARTIAFGLNLTF